MRIFISSVITGYEDYRAAAARGATVLGHGVVRAEDFSASPRTPQQACLEGVRDADAVVLLLGDRYGAIQASGRSATHEEFVEASGSKPLFVFHQNGVSRDDDMAQFVEEVQAWDSGRLSGQFRTPDELRDAVTKALADFAVDEQRHRVTDAEVVDRAIGGAVVNTRNVSHSVLTVSVAAGPTQSLLRPSDIEAESLRSDLLQSAMFGPARVIDPSRGGRSELDGHTLQLFNEDSSVTVSPTGDVVVRGQASTSGTLGLSCLVEEDVREQIHAQLSFTQIVLQRIDPTAKIRSVAVAVSITAGATGWRTRAEAAANPNTMTLAAHGADTSVPIVLDPPVLPRQHLQHRVDELADDFTVLMRRRFVQ